MSVYSIKELEYLTNIKSHTIRIWEKRYKLLQPERTETNIRVYNDDQLKKILNVALLVQRGMKISKIADLKETEIDKLIMDEVIEEKDNFSNRTVMEMIHAGLNYDLELFESTFDKAIKKLPLESVIMEIIYPTLFKIGMMWQGNQMFPSQEHFISQLVKRKLFTAIDGIKNYKKSGQKWLLFIPEDELHEIGLLFAHYILSQKGHEIIYLGERVPLSNLPQVNKDVQPTHLLYFININSAQDNCQYIVNDINSLFSKQKIYISGTKEILEKLDLKETIWLKEPNSLIQLK